MNHAPGSTLSPFATGLVPAGFDDLFPLTEDDANGNRDSAGSTVGTLTRSKWGRCSIISELTTRPRFFSRFAVIRHSIRRGTPFGTKDWASQTAEKLGLESFLRPQGRPRKQEK